MEGELQYFASGLDNSDATRKCRTNELRGRNMKPRIYTAVMMPVTPIGNFRSYPAEVGSASPSYPIAPPRPLEHPQEMSNPAETRVPPLEPGNGSNLALGCPLELPVEPGSL